MLGMAGPVTTVRIFIVAEGLGHVGVGGVPGKPRIQERSVASGPLGEQ